MQQEGESRDTLRSSQRRIRYESLHTCSLTLSSSLYRQTRYARQLDGIAKQRVVSKLKDDRWECQQPAWTISSRSAHDLLLRKHGRSQFDLGRLDRLIDGGHGTSLKHDDVSSIGISSLCCPGELTNLFLPLERVQTPILGWFARFRWLVVLEDDSA